MYQPQRDDGGKGDEVDQYLSIGVVQSSGFIDALSWWSARKQSLPGHYAMAMDINETPATLTPSERVNSAAKREFTCTRQSMSSSVFIMTMCLRSWMYVGSLKVPANRAQVAAALAQDDANNNLRRSRRTGMRRSLTMVSFRCSTTSSPTWSLRPTLGFE